MCVECFVGYFVGQDEEGDGGWSESYAESHEPGSSLSTELRNSLEIQHSGAKFGTQSGLTSKSKAV